MHRRSGCFALLVLALYGSVTFATLATDSQAGTRKGRADAGKEAVPGNGEDFIPPDPVPIPAMSPEELPATPPRVSYHDGKLWVDAENASLGELLEAIGSAIGAQIEKPAATDSERVAAHLSGPPRRVIAALLDDGKFGYLMLYPAQDPAGIQRIVLTGPTRGTAENSAGPLTASASPVAQPTPASSLRARIAESAVSQSPPNVADAGTSSVSYGAQLSENIAHANKQIADAKLQPAATSADTGSDTVTSPQTTEPAPASQATADKTPMQVLQDLIEARRRQMQQNQAQKPQQE
jgi:hypothetical protein